MDFPLLKENFCIKTRAAVLLHVSWQKIWVYHLQQAIHCQNLLLYQNSLEAQPQQAIVVTFRAAQVEIHHHHIVLLPIWHVETQANSLNLDASSTYEI